MLLHLQFSIASLASDISQTQTTTCSANTMSQTSFLWVVVVLIHVRSCVFTVSLPLVGLKCHEDERSALLEFKHAFFSKSLCDSNDGFSKLGSWTGKAGDCCAWDGVECDKRSGHVVGLDLENSCLYGSISSKAALFRLVHLQRLNLAANDFASSRIPPAISNFRGLTNLDLSYSSFAGQIPLQLLKLTNLSYLDLSGNPNVELKNPNISSLVQSLTKLMHLNLSYVAMATPLPEAITNLSSLRSILLQGCNLQGELPIAIFSLPWLEVLDLSHNEELSINMPEFYWSSPLKSLLLSWTNFLGRLPTSLGNLASLTELYITNSGLSGSIPSSIGQLIHLSALDLNTNQLTGEIPFSLGNLVGLTYLDLSSNQLSGEILPALMKLNQLTLLDVKSNQIAGEIPPQIEGLTQALKIDLSFNKLHGPIPRTISSLNNLNYLGIGSNNLNGTAKLDMFFELESLQVLLLSFNNFSSIHIPNLNSNLSKMVVLGLASCNFREFPRFLVYLDKLEWLDLSHNSFHGQIPWWFYNVSNENLAHLNLSNNYLTEFRSYPVDLKWSNLETLDLRYNDIQGRLPIPPASISFYLISNNKLSGEIPLAFCQLTSIQILDLAKNQLTGVLPSCLSNLSDTLLALSLQANKFYGRIPQFKKKICELKMVDFSDNQLQGPLPRGLDSCVGLEFLNFGNNHIMDTFPSWLGSLPNLKVLILHSNRFHGVIREAKANHHHQFPKLHIIDLSMNNFSGSLPSVYFTYWIAMKVGKTDKVVYYADHMVQYAWFTSSSGDYDYSITLINKGMEMKYVKILEYLTVIDFSSNNFIGEIPNSLGFLKELHLLNFSNNALTGSIPSSLGNLTKLEALDLSRNKLSREIPLELIQLTSLAFFNVSDNSLSGPIPQGKQFYTFENDSYIGNLGLCGPPLTKKCGNIEAPQPKTTYVSHEDNLSTWIEEIDWKIVLMGFGSGLVVGVILGENSTTRIQYWFARKFCGQKRRRQR